MNYKKLYVFIANSSSINIKTYRIVSMISDDIDTTINYKLDKEIRTVKFKRNEYSMELCYGSKIKFHTVLIYELMAYISENIDSHLNVLKKNVPRRCDNIIKEFFLIYINVIRNG